jgi:hypothetical protein
MFQDSHEWVLWQARDAVGERQPGFEVALPPPAPKPKPVRKKRQRHWGGSFQEQFSRWLKGDSERPCDLGYTRRELMRHLQRQFSKGMTWDNYAGNCSFKSKRAWVVDHIVPKYTFSADEIVQAYALSNLRPLWMADNLKKSMQRTHLL